MGDARLLQIEPFPRDLPQLCVHHLFPKVSHELHQHLQHPCTAALDHLGQLLWRQGSRDAVFRVLAVEQPQAVVLNYAPGPLDTPMIEDLLGDVNTHQVVRTMFEDLKRTRSLLNPSDSAQKLVALLRKRNFKSGDHVDYYDEKVKEAGGEGGGGSATPTPPPATSTTPQPPAQ